MATGTPPFLPWGEPGSFGLFSGMTWLFGDSIFELRVPVQLVCLGMAILLYRVVTTATNRWCGFASGLVLVHHTMRDEGLTVNRDWFASAFVLGGIALGATALARPRDRRGMLLFLSGLVGATSSRREIYRLSNYPDFELVALLRADYRWVATLDGCVVYERRARDPSDLGASTRGGRSASEAAWE